MNISKDNGWLSLGPQNQSISALAIGPEPPAILYAGTASGVFISPNGGASWVTGSTGLTITHVHSLAIDPATPTTLYAGTWSGLFKSTNAGESWNASQTGLTSLDISTLAIDPKTPTTLYAGTTSGTFKSTDGGANWSAVNNGLTVAFINTLAIDPITPATLYAGTKGGGIFKSTNGAGTWSAVNSGLSAVFVNSLAIDPTMPATLYAGTEGGGMFKSTNAGASWSAINTGLAPVFINSVVIDPLATTTLYAGTEGKGVFSIRITRPNPFVKRSPTNSVTGIATNPTLVWETNSEAASYEYCYNTSNDNACGGTWTNTGTNTNVNLSGLSNNTTYYWQVRAVSTNATVYADAGAWWSFTTVPAASVSLNIHPSIQSVTSGQNFNVSIEVRAGAQPVDAAAAYVNFNPTYLQVVSVSAGSSFPMLLQNTFDNTTGQVNFSAGALSNFPTNTFTLATVTFKALAQTSNTPITFADVSPRRSDITFGGSSVLNSLGNGSVEITNTASINGSIILQGRPASPDSKWSVPLSISLTTAGSSQPAYTFTPTTDNSGKFTLTGIVPGTYQVRVKHSHTLQNLKTVTLAAGGNTIDFGTLLEGDANNDNAVSLIDFSILATTYSKCQGTAGYDSRADFNGDTCITLLDFSLLVSNYGKSGATLAAGGTENPIPTRQTNEAVSIVVDPATNRTQMGKTFTVTIRVQAGSGLVDGAQVSLDFDPTKLQVKKMTGNTSVLPQVLLNAYDNSAGTIDYAAGTLANFPAGEINLVQIEFEAIAKTPATPLTFHYGAPRNTEVTFAGGSVLNGDSDGMISVDESYKVFLSLLTK